MVKVLVGSKNPVKIEAVKEAFSKFFSSVKAVGVEVDSKVSIQPVNSETFKGAKNRVLELKKINSKKNLKASFFVGIEGGIIFLFKKWFAFGAVCIMNDKGKIGYGTTCFFELPESITKELLDGKELGDVMDSITNEKNTKQKAGAIGYFTKGIMNRKNLYVNALIVALIPFLNEELYK